MKKYLLVIAFIPLIAFGCGEKIKETGGDENGNYEAFGLDSARINELINRIKDYTFPRIHSLVIFKNDELAVERYFSGYGPQTTHMLQSVTKSFTSAIVGIALDKGFISGTALKILDFFPEYTAVENLNEWKRDIRIGDILTMRTGVDYSEGYDGSPHSQLNAIFNRESSGWDLFYLNRPMNAAPGTVFNYDSGGVMLLAVILRKACGMHADALGDLYLFNPLGITQKEWIKGGSGHPHTGGGLYLLPRDMAKLGLLYLHKGVYEGRRVIPESWVERSFEKSVSLDGFGRNVVGYGYLWWIFRPANKSRTNEYIYTAWGAYGQYIFVVPEYDMVVVVTAQTINDEQFSNPQKFLYDYILEAVR